MATKTAALAVGVGIALSALVAAPASAQQLVDTIDLPVPAGGVEAVTGEMVIDQAHNRLYVPVGDFNLTGIDLLLYDGATRSLLASTSVSYPAGGPAYDPGSDRLFVPTYQGGIHVFDGTSLLLLGVFNSVPEASFAAFDAANNLLYVSQWRFPFVDVLDASSGALLAAIPVSATLPYTLELDTAHERLYMIGRTSGVYFLTIIDTTSRTVVGEEHSAPWAFMSLAAANDRLYLAPLGAASLAALDTATGQLVASGIPLAPTSPASSAIGGILYNPTSDRIHVARVQSGTLDTVDAVSYAVVSTLALGSSTDYGLMNLAVNTVTREVFVAHRDTNLGAHIPGRIHVLRDYLSVGVDIKPGGYPNSINLGSAGNVPVAVLGSASFDASSVDPLTLTLASAPVRLRGHGNAMASLQDVNSDGYVDLIVHVDTTALVLSDGDTEAQLEGVTYTGEAVRGADSVQVVP